MIVIEWLGNLSMIALIILSIVLALIILLLVLIKKSLEFTMLQKRTENIEEINKKENAKAKEKQLFLRRMTDAFLDSKRGNHVVLDYGGDFLYIKRGDCNKYGGHHIVYGRIYDNDPLQEGNYEVMYRADKSLDDDAIQTAKDVLDVMTANQDDCEVYSNG